MEITALDAVFPAGVGKFFKKATFPVDVLTNPLEFGAQIQDDDANVPSDVVSLW
jgi:hypothetical protein